MLLALSTGAGERGAADALFRLMSADRQPQLFDIIAAAMKGISAHIQRRQIAHSMKADPAYGRGIAERPGLTTRLPAAAE